jgi:YbbR domain-containing protein
MQRSTTFSGNAAWFMASLGLSFIVWVIATSQTDPFVQQSFGSIPVQVIQSPGMLITNTSSLRRTVTVNVRARQSVMDLLTNEDITVFADLTNLAPGTQVVQLVATVSETRQAVADPRPSQLTFVLERESREQKPVEVTIQGTLPAGFIAETPTTSEAQVLVTGVASRVQQVDRLEARVNLNDRRTTFSEEVELIPVDTEGMEIDDVTVAQPVRVTIEISQDDAVEVVFVNPNVNRSTLQEGYVFHGVEAWNPTTISVTGSDAALAALPEILDTQEIDLSSYTASATVNVPVILPEGITLVEPGQLIEVQLRIEPREQISTINNVPVEVVGRRPDTQVQIIPNQVTVQVSGPQPLVQELTAENISVAVDIQELAADGDYDIVPTVTLNGTSANGEAVPSENIAISVLPESIAVRIESLVDSD